MNADIVKHLDDIRSMLESESGAGEGLKHIAAVKAALSAVMPEGVWNQVEARKRLPAATVGLKKLKELKLLTANQAQGIADLISDGFRWREEGMSLIERLWVVEDDLKAIDPWKEP